jgi:hypothetical protein
VSPAATASVAVSARARSSATSISGTIIRATYESTTKYAGYSSRARGCSTSSAPGAPYAGRARSSFRERRALALGTVLAYGGIMMWTASRCESPLCLIEASPDRDEHVDLASA